ncbi:MAG: hypothetical protein GY889_02710 [Proteobacteria bacterium]|jgi:cytoskeletal protein RodZ|nr:hypothetical protein [Pseudomonadota bacterium]|tara:strand:- start:4626 stop:5147 length:522 start_codon:yes stop_codon:yes gene_type:complete
MANTPPTSDSSLAPGERLRKARQGHHWTLEDVAANLNLTVDVVRALEAGDHAALPEAIFVRGYLRAYARLMEIDETEVLGSADGGVAGSIGSVVPVIGKEAFREKKGRRWLQFSTPRTMPWRKTVIGTLLVLIVIFAAWWFSGLRPPVEQLINSSGEGGQTSGVITIPLNTGD